MPNKNPQYNLRIPPHLREQFQDLADKSGESLNSTILLAMMTMLQRKDGDWVDLGAGLRPREITALRKSAEKNRHTLTEEVAERLSGSLVDNKDFFSFNIEEPSHAIKHLFDKIEEITTNSEAKAKKMEKEVLNLRKQVYIMQDWLEKSNEALAKERGKRTDGGNHEDFGENP